MPSQTKFRCSHCRDSYTLDSRLAYHVGKQPPQCTLPKIPPRGTTRLQSIIEVGHGHAVLEVESAQTLVSSVDVREAVAHHAIEGVLNGLLLESILLGRLPRRSGFGDTTVGDNCEMQNQRYASYKDTDVETPHTVKSTSSLLRSPRFARALTSRSDFVLRAVADLLLEDFGLLLDGAEAVLDGIVGGAEVGGDVDLECGQLSLCLLASTAGRS